MSIFHNYVKLPEGNPKWGYIYIYSTYMYMYIYIYIWWLDGGLLHQQTMIDELINSMKVTLELVMGRSPSSLDSRRVLSVTCWIPERVWSPAFPAGEQSITQVSPAQMLAKSCKIPMFFLYIYIDVYVSIKANLAGETNIFLAEQKSYPKIQ